METKFKVGQMVMSNKLGEGVVVSTTYTKWPNHNIYASFGSGDFKSYRSDGTECYGDVITPINPPRVVLTEWQKKQLREYVREEFKYTALFNFFDRLESILSSPEPPKYQPKQGEAVLVKVCKDYPWVTGVFSNMEYDAYKCYGVSPVNFCRPFDASLVGKVTQD